MLISSEYTTYEENAPTELVGKRNFEFHRLLCNSCYLLLTAYYLLLSPVFAPISLPLQGAIRIPVPSFTPGRCPRAALNKAYSLEECANPVIQKIFHLFIPPTNIALLRSLWESEILNFIGYSAIHATYYLLLTTYYFLLSLLLLICPYRAQYEFPYPHLPRGDARGLH